MNFQQKIPKLPWAHYGWKLVFMNRFKLTEKELVEKLGENVRENEQRNVELFPLID